MAGRESNVDPDPVVRPVVALTLLLVTVVASALAAVVARSDVLIGQAEPVPRPVRDCGRVPAATADTSPLPPGSAKSYVDALEPLYPAPLQELGSVQVLGRSHYGTAHDYVVNSHLLLPKVWREAMESHDFATASTIGFRSEEQLFGVELVQFGSPAQAAEFARRMVVEECERGIAGHVRDLPGLVAGAAFTYHDSFRPPFRAAFAVGDVAVRLHLCVCREDERDPYEILSRWAVEVDTQMRKPVA